MINWGSLLQADYWLEGFSGANAQYFAPAITLQSGYFWGYLWLFLICILIGVGASLYSLWTPSTNPIFKRLSFVSTHFITLGLVGYALFLSRMLNFRFISGRFLMIGWAIYAGIILYMLIRYFVVYFPVEYKYYKRK